MNRGKDLPIIQEKARGLSRREAARQLLACMASGTLVWASGSHPIWKHLADEKILGAAEPGIKGSKLYFLSAGQFESLACLSEAIVPGASKAQSAEFIDLLLSVETPKEQKEFSDSLSAFETESAKRYAKKPAEIAAAEMNQMLTDASSEPKAQSLRNAFENLKEWTSGAYYSSEIGMRELGWTPDRVFAEFPGCTHADNQN